MRYGIPLREQVWDSTKCNSKTKQRQTTEYRKKRYQAEDFKAKKGRKNNPPRRFFLQANGQEKKGGNKYFFKVDFATVFLLFAKVIKERRETNPQGFEVKKIRFFSSSTKNGNGNAAEFLPGMLQNSNSNRGSFFPRWRYFFLISEQGPKFKGTPPLLFSESVSALRSPVVIAYHWAHFD